MKHTSPALVIRATLLYCAIVVNVGTAAQRIVFDVGNYVSTSIQLLRGGRAVNDVLSTFFSKDASEVEEYETVATIKKKTTTRKKRVQTFNLKENITLTLSSAEVDKNFCDPSSPLSLAGYMNGERWMHERTITTIYNNYPPSIFFMFSEGKSI